MEERKLERVYQGVMSHDLLSLRMGMGGGPLVADIYNEKYLGTRVSLE